MIKKEINLPKDYEIIQIRASRLKPHVYIYANNKFNERVGLLSVDGGKSFKEVWKRS